MAWDCVTTPTDSEYKSMGHYQAQRQQTNTHFSCMHILGAMTAANGSNFTLFSSLVPQAPQFSIPPPLLELLVYITIGLDWGSPAWMLINQGVANSTLAFYESGERRYLSFCNHFHCQPLPINKATLLYFVAFLFATSLSYQTVRSYLCAVCHLKILNNLPESGFTLSLELCLEGPPVRWPS